MTTYHVKPSDSLLVELTNKTTKFRINIFKLVYQMVKDGYSDAIIDTTLQEGGDICVSTI